MEDSMDRRELLGRTALAFIATLLPATAAFAKDGADDGPGHDAGDDHGDDGPGHDADDDHGGEGDDDGPDHDDDQGEHGDDDGPNHDDDEVEDELNHRHRRRGHGRKD